MARIAGVDLRDKRVAVALVYLWHRSESGEQILSTTGSIPIPSARSTENKLTTFGLWIKTAKSGISAAGGDEY